MIVRYIVSNLRTVKAMATITKRGDSYRIRVSCGYDVSGKQLVQSMTWKPENGMTARQIEKEVKKQATLFVDHSQ